VIAILFGATAFVFWPVRHFEFVDWDDPDNISQNAYIRLPALQAIRYFWAHFYFASYIPLTRTAWTLLWHASPQPGSFHVANLLVHLGNVLLVFALLRQLRFSAVAAGGGALLFAVHPLQVEPVALATGMKDLLAMFFSLSALLLYLPWARVDEGESIPRKAVGVFALATACFLCAMLSKAAAVFLPLVAGILGLTVGGSWRRIGLSVAFWILLAVPCVQLTAMAESQTTVQLVPVPIWQRPWVALDAYGFYLYKLAMPFGLAPDHGRTPQWVLSHPPSPFVALPPAVALLLLWRRSPWLRAAGAVFAASLVQVSGLVPFLHQNISTVADRYVYPAMLGAALAMAAVITGAHRSRTAIALCVVLLALAVASRIQVLHWRDTATLFEHGLRVNPRSSVAHTNLGVVRGKQRRLDEAYHHLRAAIQLNRRLPEAHGNLGHVLYLKGYPDSAIAEIREAIRLDPGLPWAHRNLGQLLGRYGNAAEAEWHLREALRLSPLDSAAAAALRTLQSSRADSTRPPGSRSTRLAPNVPPVWR
jgi:hypothetical protein